ncbi:hypothetical protein COCMIDRAFT_106590 [Bipolaris oryzae ATCC 44560]|uniref:Arb2 domain-containing protein n=1 Tax=Bipolaris oryzae ATCC 44560 TaxID=930090 RepID=W6YUN9_COCMI|nr:uncharacterized protein COCMIDRAFT_106590 [Bipolaris oryzae ATCC 44560]EUC41268.1 hypothetical protein COCMIDRAFT_106590 [Bipolaris oryzae ATCC 44560]
MFRRVENTMKADPSYPADLKQLGFFINDTGHIRMIDAPNRPHTYCVTNNERVNEVRCEAMHACQRREVEARLSRLGINRIYLPQYTTEKPNEPSIPILAPEPETLKTRKQITVLINDSQQDPGILSYSQLSRDLGINGGSVVNFAKKMIKHSSTHNTDDEATIIFKDNYELEDKSNAPSLLILNTSQLLYSHKHKQAMTLRSWSAMPRKSIAHDMIRIHSSNSLPGHCTPKEHIKTFFDEILYNTTRIAADAEISIIAIENSTEALVSVLAEDFEKYTSRITAIALLHCTIDASQITHPGLRNFLHQLARQWRFNDATSDPLHCTDMPTSQDEHAFDDDDDDGKTDVKWCSGTQVPCPTFAGGNGALGEDVFVDAGVQDAVLAFFEEARNEGALLGEKTSKGHGWKPQVEGPQVAFAGTMVDSELLKAAGLME